MERETDYKSLVSVLRCFEKEEDWFEFKVGNSNPEKIGEYVSALANSAAYSGHQYGYVVWGVDDATHELVGTSFRPSMEKKGNMELRSWLMTKLEPKVEISFIELDVDGHHVAILEVPAAIYCPVRFADTGYIRVGSVTQRLSAHPEIERNLWAMLDMRDVETRMAEENLSGDDLVEKLDFDAYYQYQDSTDTYQYVYVSLAIDDDRAGGTFTFKDYSTREEIGSARFDCAIDGTAITITNVVETGSAVTTGWDATLAGTLSDNGTYGSLKLTVISGNYSGIIYINGNAN